MSPELVTMTVSAPDGAALLKLTPRRLQQLAAEGVLPKPERGQYSLVGLIQGYAGYLQDERRNTTVSAASSRVADARAKAIELQIAREERELIPLESTTDILDRFAAATVTAVNNLPNRFSRDPAERARLRPFIDEARNTIAAEMKKAAQEARTGEAPGTSSPAPNRAARRRAARHGGG